MVQMGHGNQRRKYPMIGPSNKDELDKISWVDASLRSIAIDYDSVSLRIHQSNGNDSVLRADGYIGLNVVGFWDELIIERAEIVESHPGLDACIEAVRFRAGTQWLDSGNEA